MRGTLDAWSCVRVKLGRTICGKDGLIQCSVGDVILGILRGDVPCTGLGTFSVRDVVVMACHWLFDKAGE